MSIKNTICRQSLLDYYDTAARPREDWLIGMEIEQMARVKGGSKPIPYIGDKASVLRVLEYIRSHRKCDPIWEGDNLIGLDGSWGSITLEPGGQIEWSSRPRTTLSTLKREMQEHLDTINAAAAELGIYWVEEAVDPVNPISEMYWMPKARYAIMRPYLKSRGELAERMMTQSASVQVAIDFDNEQDWTRKFRAAALLAPVTTALFANSSRVDGAESGYQNYRQHIWQHTDPDRCGLPPIVFDPAFGYEAWLDWLLDVPTLFCRRSGGLISAGGVSFRECMPRVGCEATYMGDWRTHLSTIFTDVRSYHYLEVRSIDLQPPAWLFTIPTFWVGLLYNDAALGEALELAARFDDLAGWTEAMASAVKGGLDASHGDVTFRELAAKTLSIAIRGLQQGAMTAGDGVKDAQLLDAFAAHRRIDL
jgi:glutamate--cysteine ligase